MAEELFGLTIERDTVLRYTGNEEEVILPKSVLRIAPFAFAGCKTLKRVITSYKLCSIGKGAFYGCENLEYATLPGRLYARAKGGRVFPTDAKIFFRFYASPDIASAEDYSDYFDSIEAYYKSGINDADMFDENGKYKGDVNVGVEVVPVKMDEPIEEPAEDEIEPIDDEVFVEETETEPHEDIQLEENDEDPETLQEKMDAVIPQDEEPAPETYRNLVNLTDYLVDGDKVVKYIGSASVTKVPEFIKVIGEDAFSNSGVEEVELPDGVDTICKNAFAWCCKLTKINLPEGLKIIDDGAFASCYMLEQITFPQTLVYIGADAFRACSSLKELVLPQSIQNISRRAFDFCVLVESVVVPDNITVLAEGVFSHCERLQKVVLPQGIKTINAWALADCYELREINFPAGLECIEEVAFINCRSVVAFDLPHSLKRIGRQAFVGCNSLHLVNLPRHLEKQLKPQKVFYKLPSVSLVFEEEQTSSPDDV